MENQSIRRSGKSKRRKFNLKKILLSILLITSIYVLGSLLVNVNKQNLSASLDHATTLGSFPLQELNMKYGFILDTFTVFQAEIQNNQFLSDLLVAHKVDYYDIEQLVQNTKEVFDVRNLRAGKPYTILNADTTTAADYFIYEPNVYAYFVFDLKNHTANKVEREITTIVETASGVIESSLWNTMIDNGLSFELTAKMEDALAWSIDFHHIQKNDKFKLIYERHYIEGEPVGVGEIKASYFNNFDNEYYAFYYENERHRGYYDLEARPMEKAFLKSPVKYSRISSRYNLRRFHPILKRRKAHLGTDYAAPYGTPIYAVADGVVTKASRSRGNGNYVKIKHDNVYQTQYLHMQKFASGIQPGVHVKQGQTIGYVGSTGLATGPHVCFRFWKNGKQVNHLRENLPPPEPMAAEDIPKFNIIKDQLKEQLDEIEFRTSKQILASHESAQDSLLNTNP